MDQDDLDIEDLLSKKSKKKVNSGAKGKRAERGLVKILNERFGNGFSRSIGSGNRWSQVSHLPKHAQDTFSGDLVVPEHFKWVVESKHGYNEIDLNGALDGGNTQLDSFLAQSEDESKRTGRNPIMCWKKDRKPWIAFVRLTELSIIDAKGLSEYILLYRDWVALPLESLLKKQDEFWKC